MVRSECLGLVKHINLIQTIILIRLLWLSGISKICVSFADKYTNNTALVRCAIIAVAMRNHKRRDGSICVSMR